jgi:hypothetical protein
LTVARDALERFLERRIRKLSGHALKLVGRDLSTGMDAGLGSRILHLNFDAY